MHGVQMGQKERMDVGLDVPPDRRVRLQVLDLVEEGRWTNDRSYVLLQTWQGVDGARDSPSAATANQYGSFGRFSDVPFLQSGLLDACHYPTWTTWLPGLNQQVPRR